MVTDREKREKEIKELYEFVAEQVIAGLYKSDIIDKLIDLGIDKYTAYELVEEMERRMELMAKRTILLVLNSDKVNKELTQKLEVAGYDVFSAMDGETGMKIMRETVPDLIVAESKLSDIEGNELIKKLRRSPIARKIPVFILCERKLAKESFLVHRLIEFIQKPISAEDIVTKIRKILLVPKSPLS